MDGLKIFLRNELCDNGSCRIHLLDAPSEVDRRQLELRSCPNSDGSEDNSEKRGHIFPESALSPLGDADFERSCPAGCRTLSAEGAVHVTYAIAAFVDGYMVWAVSCAGFAAVAEAFVFDDRKALVGCPRNKNLKQIAHSAENSEYGHPVHLNLAESEHQHCSEKHNHPNPIFQCVRECSQRADVAAPETVDEKTAEYHKNDRCD